MNNQKYLIAGLAAGVWIFLYGFVANAIVLADYWAQSSGAALMRPEGQEVMWAIVVSCLLQGFALAYIFTRGYEGKGIGEGVRFGVLIAWFVAAMYLLWYALQPVALGDSIMGMVVDGVMYVTTGVVLALTYKK